MYVKILPGVALSALLLMGCVSTAAGGGPQAEVPHMTQPSAPDEAHSLVVTAGAKTPAPYAAPALFALECSPGRAARLVYRSSSLSVPVDPMVEAILDGAPLPLPELWQVAEETRTVTTLILPLPDAALARKLAALLSGGEKLVLRAPQSPPDIFDLRQATGSLAGCA